VSSARHERLRCATSSACALISICGRDFGPILSISARKVAFASPTMPTSTG
jgi:hypothetical protein